MLQHGNPSTCRICGAPRARLPAALMYSLTRPPVLTQSSARPRNCSPTLLSIPSPAFRRLPRQHVAGLVAVWRALAAAARREGAGVAAHHTSAWDGAATSGTRVPAGGRPRAAACARDRAAACWHSRRARWPRHCGGRGRGHGQALPTAGRRRSWQQPHLPCHDGCAGRARLLQRRRCVAGVAAAGRWREPAGRAHAGSPGAA